MIILTLFILAILYGLFFLSGDEQSKYFYNIFHTLGIVLVIAIPLYYAYNVGVKPYSGFDSTLVRQARMFVAMIAVTLLFYGIFFQLRNKAFWLGYALLWIGMFIYLSIR